MNRSRRVTVVLVLLAVAVGLVLLYRLVPTSGERPGRLQLSGNIEVTDAEVSFRIPGHVRERLVREGERVARGAVVARLESADLEHEVALRQAEAANARALLAEMTAGYRAEEVAQVRAAHAQASAELSRAESDWHRQQALFEQGLVTAREAEAARTTFEVAQGRTREARERLGMLSKGYRPEQVDQARARLQQAEEALALARTRLGYATLAAPMDGVVLAENVEPGEFVAAGTPVVTLGVLDPVWLRAYIGETDLGRVETGSVGTAGHRQLSGQELPRHGHLHRPGGRVHSEERADREGTGQARLPHQDHPPQPRPGTEAGDARRRRTRCFRQLGRP